MQSWANKYAYDYSGENKPGEFIFDLKIIMNLFRIIFKTFSRITVTSYIIVHKNKSIKNLLKYSGYFLLISALAYLAYIFINSITKMLLNMPDEAYSIPLAIAYSFLRLSAAYVICIIWTIPAICGTFIMSKTYSFV